MILSTKHGAKSSHGAGDCVTACASFAGYEPDLRRNDFFFFFPAEKLKAAQAVPPHDVVSEEMSTKCILLGNELVVGLLRAV